MALACLAVGQRESQPSLQAGGSSSRHLSSCAQSALLVAGMLGDVRPSETNPFKHHPSSGRAKRHSPRNLAEIPMPVTTSYQGIQVLSARMLLLHLTGRCSAERQREHRSLQQSSTGISATGQAAPSLGDVKEDALVPAPISPGDRAGSFPKELVRQSCLMAAPFGVERP